MMDQADTATQDMFLIPNEQLLAQFLREIPRVFRRAALALEYDKILSEHLKYAHTPLGRSTLAKELIPKLDRDLINSSQSEIEELRTLLNSGEVPSFTGIVDIRTVLHKVEIEGSTLFIDEGQPLLQTLRGMRQLRDFFAGRTKATPTIWKSAVHLFEDRLIEMAFDSVFEENGSVRDSASAELNRIRRDIVTTGERLRSKLAALIKKFTDDDLLQENIITQRDGRSVIPVKTEHKRKVAGMIHSVSQTGQTIYIEPAETIELNNELRSFEFAEQREVDRILRELTDRLRSSVPAILRSMEIVGHLESIYAKSKYATVIEASNPTIGTHRKPEENVIVLREARHPFLIAKLGKSGTVPFSLSLDHNSRTLILTGPNAGGKTVLLKSVGLLFLMTHAGLPIPAMPDAVLPLIDGLYVDIGDAQSIADDLSTFSSHIKSLKEIIEHANEYSIVLLDEIGSGTAPEEGGALAESILEYLTKNSGFTLATTHFGRLAAFGETYVGAVNGSMEFSESDLKPTYRFRIGIPGSSHAFDIAERYELPRTIINHAREIAGGKTSRLDELLHSLSMKEQDLASRKAEMEKELGKSRIARLEYERLSEEISTQKKKILAEASNKADDLLGRANSLVERAIREAREAAGQYAKVAGDETATRLSELRSRQKEELRKIEKEVSKSKSENISVPQSGPELTLGARVRLISNPAQVGEVISVKGDTVDVSFGSLMMKAKVAQLEVVSNKDARNEERKLKQFGTFFDEAFSPRIDLRGKYGDEGVIEVEKFLATANARGLNRVEILHGTGTGALGRRIHQALKSNPDVASFRFGERTEGGMGVTIVELK
ncbi:MAG: endonuclease MutS2 [Bacteroidota bacterium]|nr:endonuclease MutS2 [Bacteroidota bacterium]MDP4235389.1 endonuclease MutS2 [Bacteroidota bacterium]